jgi:molybdopterin-guanine dinucleotide biosynthesis protein A
MLPGARVPQLTIVIQAGGCSRRMGRDKALMPFLSETLIERIIRRLAPLKAEMFVTTNQPEGYRFLGLPLVPDKLPITGALGGLLTALEAASSPLVAVIACDMPFVNPCLLGAQGDLAASQGWDAVVPRHPAGIEPLHAVYSRQACLPAVQEALAGGCRRADSWFGEVRTRWLAPEESRLYDPEGLSFINLNTPDEFEHAETIAATRSDL